jgi:hypothetical protein
MAARRSGGCFQTVLKVRLHGLRGGCSIARQQRDHDALVFCQ